MHPFSVTPAPASNTCVCKEGAAQTGSCEARAGLFWQGVHLLQGRRMRAPGVAAPLGPLVPLCWQRCPARSKGEFLNSCSSPPACTASPWLRLSHPGEVGRAGRWGAFKAGHKAGGSGRKSPCVATGHCVMVPLWYLTFWGCTVICR